MTGLFALVRVLLVDARSIRAIGETELDWRHERDRATSAVGRRVVTVRAILACLRVCALSTRRELRCIPFAWFGWRMIAFTAVFVILLAGKPILDYYQNFERASAGLGWSNLSLFVLLVPQAFGVAVPLAAFYTLSAQPPRRVPLLALSVLGFVLMLLTVGWVVPAANAEFTERGLAILSRPAPTVERPVHQSLYQALSSDPVNYRTISSTLALSVAAMAWAVLGRGVSRLTPWRRRLSWIIMPLAVVILANVTGMALHLMADVLDLEWRTRVVGRQLAIEAWILSLVPLVAGAWLLREPGDVQGATEFVN